MRETKIAVALIGACLAACSSPEGQESAQRGPQLAFVSDRDGDFEIYLLDLAADSLVNLTNHPGMDYGFSWSPDGTAIAFASDRDGNQEIYVMSVEERSVSRVTRNEARDGQPSWSPDGTRIAFVSRRDSESGELYVMNVDGSEVRRITENHRYEEVPSWAPNGEALAFGALAPFEEGSAATLQIFRVDLASGEESQLTFIKGHNSAPRWTPDGSAILFYGQVGEGFGGADIMVINPDGGGLRNLTNDREPDWQPDPNPEGTLIVFARGPGDPLDLWTMTLDGEDRRPVVTRAGRDEQPKWRPRVP